MAIIEINTSANPAFAEIPDSGGAYTPADPSQWAAPAPTTAQEALDRLAEAIFNLTDGTPIP
jgi:hypothetical protein